MRYLCVRSVPQLADLNLAGSHVHGTFTLSDVVVAQAWSLQDSTVILLRGSSDRVVHDQRESGKGNVL